MTLKHIAITVRVCCKLHNLCIDNFNDHGPVDVNIHEEDRVWRRGKGGERVEQPDFVGLGLGMGNRAQGERSDLHHTRRKDITEQFRLWHIRRPAPL